MVSLRESPRVRRLRSDLKALQLLRAESTILDFETRAALADPPHEYHIRFEGRGVWRPPHSLDVLVRDFHEVTIRLGANYPRMMPELLWRSPIFHPNISSSGVVCLGGYGTFWAPSLNLDELCVMLWEMVRYANYDVNSPYNREAALWAKTQNQYRLPLDSRPLRDRVKRPAASVTSSPIASAPPIKPAQPDIHFLSDVVETEVIDAEVIEAEVVDEEPRASRHVFGTVPSSPFAPQHRADILIIE
jgi:ubiquitin-protein ligase